MVIVAGGFGGTGEDTTTSEIWEIGSDQWRVGPTLPLGNIENHHFLIKTIIKLMESACQGETLKQGYKTSSFTLIRPGTLARMNHHLEVFYRHQQSKLDCVRTLLMINFHPR